MKHPPPPLRTLDPNHKNRPQPKERSRNGSRKDRQDRQPQSQKRSHHRHQLHVSEAHAFNPAPAQIKRPGSVQKRRPNRRSQQRIHQRKQPPGNVRAHRQLKNSRQRHRKQIIDRNQQTENNSRREPRQRQLVGQQMRLGIRENEPQQQERKHRALQRGQRQPKLPIEQKKKPDRNQLDNRISRRNLGLGSPALPAQKNPAQNGNIVVKPNRLPAPRTRRPRPHHRQPLRHPIDAHIQEAAKHQPHREHSASNNRIHPTSARTHPAA